MGDVTIELSGVSAECKVGRLRKMVTLPPRKRSKREQLWHEDPLCYWCGLRTFLTCGDEKQSSDSATEDHLYSNWHPNRKTNRASVLACFECNTKRGKCEARYEQFVPQLEHRRQIAIETSALPFLKKPTLMIYRPS